MTAGDGLSMSCHTFNFQVVLGHALNSQYTRHYDRPHHVIYIDLSKKNHVIYIVFYFYFIFAE
jgi:hypothetical protein